MKWVGEKNVREESKNPTEKKRENQNQPIKKSRERDKERVANGKEGEIVPDLDLRGSGPSDVSIS